MFICSDLGYDLPRESQRRRGSTTMVSLKGGHFVKDIILTCVRWYVAYPLSYRQVEELLEERGMELDHATIHRWVLKYSPQLEEAFHPRKRPVGRRWRMDETSIRVKGEWR
jgi:putative transposase